MSLNEVIGVANAHWCIYSLQVIGVGHASFLISFGVSLPYPSVVVVWDQLENPPEST